MYSEEIDDNLQIIPIRDKLSKMLGQFVPEVHDELAATFEDEFHVDGDGEDSFPPYYLVRDAHCHVRLEAICRSP